MIQVYYRGSCGSSKQAFSWFEKYNIDVQKQNISKITKRDLYKLLQISDGGLKDITKRQEKSGDKVKKALSYMELLSFNEALNFLLSHPYVLQSPIIMDEYNYLIGYNEDEIRIFLPKEYRRCRI
ncbi:ArsC/Spx/MgsR family protein [Lactococcus petauri]|uniref:ArsC/Spx/MgsR family protein n=1 Tax=Lactococcus petauri TaxID=1940789 RepID=UPI003851B88F